MRPFFQAIFFSCFFLIPLSLLALEKPEQKEISTCIACHQEMEDEHHAPVTLWEKSIHHQMGNNCEGCHGGDPTDLEDAMSPEKGFVGAPTENEIASFCGKCHVGVKENYMKSPHYEAALVGEGPHCVTCHHSHDVQKASFDLISEALCTQCHSYANAQKIKQAFVTAELALQENKDQLGVMERRGMPVQHLEKKWFALRNSLHQITHTLDVVEIEGKTQVVLKDLSEMNTEMEIFKKTIHKRWLVGVGIALFLIALIIVLKELLKTYGEEE